MQPISYIKHCGPGCHPLDVDARLPDAVPARHPGDRPRVSPHALHRGVRAVSGARATRAGRTGRGQAEDAVPGPRTRPGGVRACCARRSPPSGERGGGTAGSTARGRLGRPVETEQRDAVAAGAERIGAGVGVSAAARRRAGDVQAEVRVLSHRQLCARSAAPRGSDRDPSEWLPHSVFDHGAHRPLTCTECHKAT